MSMNCENCGAPLDWDGSRPVIVCEFCTSISKLEETGAGPDRTAPLGIPGESNCPRCLVALTKSAMDGSQVEQCRECGGILLTTGVFGTIVRNRRATFRGAELHPTPLDPVQLTLHLTCPRCERRMDVHPYYGPGNAVIDSCGACGLVWLDCGEMSAIERSPGLR